MSYKNWLDCYIASPHHKRFYRERHERLGISLFTFMRPSGGGIPDACDSMNTVLFAAFRNGESPTPLARDLFQHWIDGDITCADVIDQLRESGDILIFRDAKTMWLEICGSYHD